MFEGDASTVRVKVADLGYAEAQLNGVIGTDFEYSADLTATPDAEAHLQFRISDEGRYGVRLTATGIAFYEFHTGPKTKPCSDQFPGAITHCPNWQYPDNPDFRIVQEVSLPGLSLDSTHRLTVRASGFRSDVLLDGKSVMQNVSSTDLKVGRFGIYAFGAPAALHEVTFSNVHVSTDPVAASNFVLLYNTPGYDARGTKRALVRTLNDVPSSVSLSPQSRYFLRRSNGSTAATGALTQLPGKTFGMQLWEADFSSITEEGSYTLSVECCRRRSRQSRYVAVRAV